MKAWPILGILIVQTLLSLVHWFLYSTWIDFWWPLAPGAALALRLTLILLSATFISAALLGFRVTNPFVSFNYQVASIWLGLVNFLLFGACLAWLADLGLRLVTPGVTHLQARPYIAAGMLAASVLMGGYGIINARRIRIRRLAVTLPNLPDAWRGRRAAVLSDIHLGNINGVRYARRISAITRELDPDVIFIPGDLYDGTRSDAERLAAPLFELTPPLGVYYVSGNHDEFEGANHYGDALRRAGVHVLNNEHVMVDCVHIAGVNYRSSTQPMRLRRFLTGLELNNGTPSILLQHVPNRLPIIEQAGVDLLLSGHTHGGQVFPFSWITRRAFGEFTYGLQRFGDLQVYTSSGAGTWGPPMRVGTHSEIVLLTFH